MSLRLDALTADDCEIVLVWRNDVLHTLRTPFALTSEQQASFYRSLGDRHARDRYYAIRRDVTLVGMGGLTGIQWENGIAEISLIIDPARRGSGLGAESVALLLDEAFGRLRLETVFGEAYYTNERAVEFWHREAVARGGTWTNLPRRKFWNGHLHGSFYFSIARPELSGSGGAVTGTGEGVRLRSVPPSLSGSPKAGRRRTKKR